MSNVLPQQAKRAVWGMYRSRFLIAGALVFILVAALSALALSPSYIVLYTEQGRFSEEAKADTSASQQDRATIIHTQALLNILSPLLATSSPSQAIAKVIDARPSGVTVYHMTLTTGHPSSIIVSGTASTIEAINKYQNALRAEPLFDSVSVPVADLAGTGNGEFSVTISGNF